MRKFGNVFCCELPTVEVVVVAALLPPPPPQAAARSASPVASNARLTYQDHRFLRITSIHLLLCTAAPVGPRNIWAETFPNLINDELCRSQLAAHRRTRRRRRARRSAGSRSSTAPLASSRSVE